MTASEAEVAIGTALKMNEPDRFTATCEAVVNDMATALSRSPQERQEKALATFGDSMRSQWRNTFPSVENVDGMVDDLITRIRARIRALEGGGAGAA